MIRAFEGSEVIVGVGSETLVILDQDDPEERNTIHLAPLDAIRLGAELLEKGTTLILQKAGPT